MFTYAGKLNSLMISVVLSFGVWRSMVGHRRSFRFLGLLHATASLLIPHSAAFLSLSNCLFTLSIIICLKIFCIVFCSTSFSWYFLWKNNAFGSNFLFAFLLPSLSILLASVSIFSCLSNDWFHFIKVISSVFEPFYEKFHDSLVVLYFRILFPVALDGSKDEASWCTEGGRILRNIEIEI